MWEGGATGFIRRADLSRDRDEQKPERFDVGQKFDAMVTGFDKSKKPTLSIKAMQIAEEKQAVAQYGSSDSGASLGRSEEHTSELQSLMRISYAVLCLKKKKNKCTLE